MLPEATFVFLDELLNANSAILNSLLLALNERMFRRGREKRELPTLTVIGASNRLPEDDALGALYDRFMLRVRCDNVAPEELARVLVSGWKLDLEKETEPAQFSVEAIRRLQRLLREVDLNDVRAEYLELVFRLRHAGIQISDRRAVKLQRMLAASALLCGRLRVNRTDLWVMRYIWDTEEQQDVLATMVGDVLKKTSSDERATGHPRSIAPDRPDPERLAQDLEQISRKLSATEAESPERVCLQDQLGVLAARCQWIADEQQRVFLEGKINVLLKQFEAQQPVR
jgi:MoxR-like ATPase